MIILISAIAIATIAVLLAKRIFVKRLQTEYEKCLLKGDMKKSAHLGKMYYLSLNETTRKQKGIVDIDAKISDDFRAFNNHHFNVP